MLIVYIMVIIFHTMKIINIISHVKNIQNLLNNDNFS